MFTGGGAPSPIGLSCVREAGAAVLLFAAAATFESPLRPPPPGSHARLALLGALLGSFQLCFAVGIALTDAATAALFQCVEPTTAALLAALVGSEQLTAAKALSALLAGGGVLMMQLGPRDAVRDPTDAAPPSGAGRRLVGCALLFCQGVGVSAYCVVQRSLVRPPAHSKGHAKEPSDDEEHASVGLIRDRPVLGPITVTAHAHVGSLALMALAAAADGGLGLERVPPLSAAGLGALAAPRVIRVVVYAVLFSSCAGYALRAWANRRLDASALVLYNALQPPLTAALALAVPGTPPYRASDAGGTALVLAALAVSSRGLPSLRGGKGAPSRARNFQI